MDLIIKGQLPTKSFRFNKAISDDDLCGLMGDAEIVRVVRGAWLCDVEFRSAVESHVLEKRVEDWFEERRRKAQAQHERDHEARFGQVVDDLWTDIPGLPVTQTFPDGRKVEGYRFIDDNDNWIYVFPDNKV